MICGRWNVGSKTGFAGGSVARLGGSTAPFGAALRRLASAPLRGSRARRSSSSRAATLSQTPRLFLLLLPGGLFFDATAGVGFDPLALLLLGFEPIGLALLGLFGLATLRVDLVLLMRAFSCSTSRLM